MLMIIINGNDIKNTIEKSKPSIIPMVMKNNNASIEPINAIKYIDGNEIATSIMPAPIHTVL